jgi:Asp-tRNA(Asn)/Glu-tRNA(Gln) amidotransferase A subunit family amidase
MAYTPKKITLPRISGFSLQMSAWALEHDFPGRLLATSILSDLGIERFRQTPIDEDPVFHGQVTKPSNPTKSVTGTDSQTYLPTTKIIESIDTTVRPENTYHFPSVLDYAKAYRDGSLKPTEVADRIIEVLDKQNRGNPPLYGFVSWRDTDILSQAKESEKRILEGNPRSVFEGVPVAVKDEIDVKGHCTGLGTSFKNQSPALTDAFVVKRLREAGAIILGKTNMHEIGIGVTGLNPFHGTPVNPYAPWRYPGGSSSGSASVVAAGICPVALGTDGGGSVRIPAAYCGIFGLKTTWGRFSSTGEYPLGYTVGNIGVLGGNLRDLALTYLVCAGNDPEDPKTHFGLDPDISDLAKGIKGVKIGVYSPWFDHGRDEVVKTAREALEQLKQLGAEIIEIDIPDLDLLRLAHLVTISSEMRSAMAQELETRKSDFGIETRSSLALARYLTVADYIKAQKIRSKALKEFQQIYEQVDVIATPTTGNLPPRIHKSRLLSGVSDLGSMNQTMRFAFVANMLGNPAITVPAGFVTAKSKIFWNSQEEKDEDGNVYSQVPVGLQFIGRHWEESLLLRIATQCEELVIRPKPRVYLSPYESDNPRISGKKQ